MNDKSKKIAIVTGATAGIGKVTALLLTQNGYKVYGTSRNEGNEKIKGQFDILKLDVTDNLSVNNLVKQVIDREGRIDLLVNNAGYGIIGGAEESSIEQGQKLFESNFFGCVRMINAVLPQMRKQGEGRIINLSSVLGRIPAPFLSLYSATKHAVEGYSESLDHEIRTLNIRSILIEPAFTKTNFEQSSLLADGLISAYDKGRATIQQISKEAMVTGDEPEIVAIAILKAATDKNPKVRYTAGKVAKNIIRIRRFVPESLYDAGVRKNFKLDA